MEDDSEMYCLLKKGVTVPVRCVSACAVIASLGLMMTEAPGKESGYSESNTDKKIAA